MTKQEHGAAASGDTVEESASLRAGESPQDRARTRAGLVARVTGPVTAAKGRTSDR